MNAHGRQRKRAVRLTPEALEELQAAVVQRWQSESTGDKLTRQARADILGVSLATSTRIFARDGVDRATLSLAFKSVGLSWDDSRCEISKEEPPSEESGEPSLDNIRSESSHHSQSSSRKPLLYAAAIGVLVTVGAVWLGSSTLHRRFQTKRWTDEYKTAYEEGMARYHRADYAGANVLAERAIALARSQQAAGEYSDALRLVGDVRGAEGRLLEASQAYREALHLRTLFDQDAQRPALLEALGDVETRRGDLAAARQALTESLQGYRFHGDPVGVALASRSLGSVAYKEGNLDEADKRFDDSLRGLKGTDKAEIVMDVEGRRALVMLRRGQAAEARETLRRCKDFWSAKNHPRWVAVSELRLGMAEARLARAKDAEACFRSSLATYQRLGDSAGADEARKWLARLGGGASKAPKFGSD